MDASRKVSVQWYEGELRRGLRHGVGTFHYADGSKYQGEWRHGEKHGLGVALDADGTARPGIYQNDRLSAVPLPEDVEAARAATAGAIASMPSWLVHAMPGALGQSGALLGAAKTRIAGEEKPKSQGNGKSGK